MGIIRKLLGKTITKAFKDGSKKIEKVLPDFKKIYDSKILEYNPGTEPDDAEAKVNTIIKNLNDEAAKFKPDGCADDQLEAKRMQLLGTIRKIKRKVLEALQSKDSNKKIREAGNKIDKIVSITRIQRKDLENYIKICNTFKIEIEQENGDYLVKLIILPYKPEIETYLTKSIKAVRQKVKLVVDKSNAEKIQKKFLKLKMDINEYRESVSLKKLQ